MALTLGTGSVGGVAHRRAPYFRTKKLGLLGSTLSLDYAPWDDPSWTLAAHPCCRPRCRREPDWYIDLHPPATFKLPKGWNPKYYQWLQRLQTPIFMQKNYPEIPMSVEYPLPRIQAEYRSYFTNLCSYLIALAMTEGVTHIGLFGCQYAHETEHGVQRDSLTYWLGRFEQAGGTVVIPPKHNSLLCSPALLYGYESHDLETGKLVPQYRATPTVKVKKADGTEVRHELAEIDLSKTSERARIAPLGNGEKPAWDRYEELFAHV
jgi:hypothetical protein